MRRIIVFILLVLTAIPVFSAVPGWYNDPYSFYNKKLYVVGVGYGKSQDEADKSAISSLASYFGVSVDSITTTYDVEDVSSYGTYLGSSYENSTTLGVSISDLKWITIDERVKDGNTYYSLALLEKLQAANTYLEMANSIADNLPSLLSYAEKNMGSFKGLNAALNAKKLCSTYKDYSAIISLLMSNVFPHPNKIDVDMVEEIVKKCTGAINIALEVDEDVNGALKNSLTSFITSLGLSTQDKDAQYALRANVDVIDYPSPRKGYTYFDFDITIELYDKVERATLFSYSESGREGHRGKTQAKALIAKRISKIVDGGFAESFSSQVMGQ